MGIQRVVFDLGGVVFRFDPRRRLQAMALATPLSAVQVDGALWGSGFSEDCDRGHYDAQEQAREARERAKLALDYGELRDAWVSAFDPDREVLALIDRLQPDVAPASFSNNSELVRFGLEHQWPEVMRRFQPTIWTYEARALKPAREAYAYAARVLATPPDAICLIDDDQGNVAGARDAGWDAVHFTGAAALQRDLDARGLLRPA